MTKKTFKIIEATALVLVAVITIICLIVIPLNSYNDYKRYLEGLGVLEQDCTSVCETCGLCTDKNCDQEGHESKCKGHGTEPGATNVYDAFLDNTYVSNKTFLGEYKYGSQGVSTNGADKSDEYSGGIGSMDQRDRYINYTFTVNKAGKADFIWNVAGSAWNSLLETNDGIEDMADHMTVTIDGKGVDVSGIALPAGTGTSTTEIWWNIQQVILKDVALTAGTHTFSCAINTTDSGLNIGSMEIYFATDDGTELDPVVVYDAFLDNTYVSGKSLVGKYVSGSQGVATNGVDMNTEYSGGIGQMDKVGRYITYTFTVDKDGKADFIWNVAGSKWNSAEESNDGLADMANHMTVTIDGNMVDVSGIALPAGAGSSTTEMWWNLQKVILKDVALKAGTHTFSCTINTDYSGLNIGSMEIYFAAA